MRIVIDLQGAQTESRFRGIGRYTLAFAQGVLRNRGEHEILLVLSGLFPDTIEPIRAAFRGLLPAQNILVWHAPGPVQEGQPGNSCRREVAELLREAFLASLQPDLIHICSLFEGYSDDAVTSIGRFDTGTPVSVILYDLIPLLNPAQYLKPNPAYERYYLRKIESLQRAALYLAISDFARLEAIDTLGLAHAQVCNVSTAIEAFFQPQTLDAVAAQQCRHQFGINRPFVLYVGGADERKNLPRLIQAYAALPAPLRAQHQLVLVGRWHELTRASLQQSAHAAGLRPDELVFTGYASDADLTQLYNLCQLYVFPSWHEGFGLPALEAMACGAPVIGANTSSLPEVIGLDEALFDPFDTAAIARKMAQALQDAALRERLRQHGLQQATKFSWDATAQRALRAWEQLPARPAGAAATWRHTHEQLAGTYARLVQGIAAVAAAHGANADADAELQPIAQCIERNEQALDRYLRPVALPAQISWRIEGPFDSSYSLALVNRELARALSAQGHRVALHSTEGPGDFAPNPAYLLAHPDLAEMHRQSALLAPLDAHVSSRNLYPPRVADMASRYNFLHAYGWEESGFPLDWVDAFNSSLQGLTVMSRHVQKIMVDHGVTVPIDLSSLGVDHWQRIEPDPAFALPAARTFRFLHVSSCFPRKGADVMLRAYGRAFRGSDDVTLVIKTFPNPHNEIERWLAEARAQHPDFPHVILLQADYTDAQLKALYGHCHALVAPSRAEGFGLPLAEAMLSGLAVIATGWSGQTDFCSHQTAWLIDYTFAPAQTHFGLSASVWAEPDEQHLAQLMREVHQAPVPARQQRIQAGQRLLLGQFCWSHAAARMVEAARRCARPRPTAEPRIGWVSTWNTPCGIASYSEHLIAHMPGQVTVLAAHAATQTAADGPSVQRCWQAGEHDDLQQLAQAIEAQQLDTLVIQFNYGFFNFPTFASFLHQQIDAGRTLLVALHASTDPAHAPHKKLQLLAPALQRCQRLLVHTVGDLNRLKPLGLVQNVALFPHGLIDYTPPPPPPPAGPARPFRLATYGFFLPHKGLLELIEAVGLLQASGLELRLSMVNAQYPVPESGHLIEQARQKISALGLQQVVTLCTDYLSDAQSLATLAQADLIVFPYQATGESSSAAARYGLASGRAVAVTPLAIFDDAAPAVHRLPGTSPADLAAGISRLALDFGGVGALLREKEQQADQWRAAHRYSKIGPRLYRLLQALRLQASQPQG